MRYAGLIGGMSWESSVLYYQWINRGVREKLGGLHSAPLILHSVDFAKIEAFQHSGDWDSASACLVDAARSLQHAGAEFLVICTNTMHKVAEAIETEIDLPLLHIVDPTAEAIKNSGIKKVGLLGTQFTMADSFYRDRMQQKHGLGVLIPDEREQADIHRIIYQELCLGEVSESSRLRYLEVIDSLYASGAESVILGCTEITLLVEPEHTAVPLFDTTALHAQAAVNWILDSAKTK